MGDKRLTRNHSQQAPVTKMTSTVYETLRYITFYQNRYGILFRTMDANGAALPCCRTISLG
jgi:hypothetical protein